MIDNTTDEINFLYRLLLTDRQISKLHETFVCNSTADINLSKTQIYKIIQLGGCLRTLLETLMKVDLPLIKNVIKPLAESELIPLGLIEAASAADAGNH